MTRPGMTGPTGYPDSWRPPGAPPPDEPPNVEALALAIDAYIAALTDEEFAALVERVRNGRQQQRQEQRQQQPVQQRGF